MSYVSLGRQSAPLRDRLPLPAQPLQVFSMSPTLATSVEPFVDRRNYAGQAGAPRGERRQFTNSHEDLSPDARELAQAIDSYKLVHRRRFITYEEMLAVMKSLGYTRQ